MVIHVKQHIIFFCIILLIQLSFGQGLELVPENEYKTLKSPPVQSGAGGLPARYVIPASAFPPPGSQGQQPSCVGWSVGFSFMSFYQAAKNNRAITNEYTFSPSYLYQSIRECADCTCGSRLDYALDFLKNTGIVPLASFPYDQNRCAKPATTLQTTARQYKISDWFRIEDIKNLTEIKTYLSNDMPVIVSVKTDDAFQNFLYKKETDTYAWNNSEDYGNHAMLIVGYDNTRGAFKLLNSWGTSWGANGYGWVDYASFRNMANQGFVVEKDYERRVEPTPPPTTTTTATAANFRPYALKEPIRDGRNYYTFGFNIDEKVRNSVSKIVYVYDHPSFYNKYVTSTTAPNFTNSYEGWGCLKNMRAIVYFTNGTTLSIPFDGCQLAERAPATDINLSLVDIHPIVTAEPTSQAGRYYFRIKLRGIESVKEKVVKVTYDRNHSSFTQRYVTTTNKANNFEGGYDGWGCLRNLGVTVYFTNNTSKTFTINMCEELGW